MIKKHFSLTIVALFSAIILGSVFQNCGQVGGFESGELSSLSQEIQGDDGIIIKHNEEDNHWYPVAPKPAIDYTSMLMDRHQLFGTFTDIFGPHSGNLAAIKRLGMDWTANAGNCSVYDGPSAEVGGCSLSEPRMSANSFAGANVLRLGLVNSACTVATNSSTTLSYALAQIKSSTDGDIPASSDENILRLFSLFYRYKPAPSESLVDSLRLLLGEQPSIESWKSAIHTVCVSGYWQVL